MPLIAGSYSSSTQPFSEGGTELHAPLADRLMADHDATLGQQILNVAKAEVEAEVEPNGMGDDVGREAIARYAERSAGATETGIKRGLSPISDQVDNSQTRPVGHERIRAHGSCDTNRPGPETQVAAHDAHAVIAMPCEVIEGRVHAAKEA